MNRLIAIVLILAGMLTAEANEPVDLNLLNHLSVGANAGTTGFGADLAFPVIIFLQTK